MIFFCTVVDVFRYESCIDVELQQRAVEYFTLSRKGAALVDIMAEMPKFPERQVRVLQYLHTIRFRSLYSGFVGLVRHIFDERPDILCQHDGYVGRLLI